MSNGLVVTTELNGWGSGAVDVLLNGKPVLRVMPHPDSMALDPPWLVLPLALEGGAGDFLLGWHVSAKKARAAALRAALLMQRFFISVARVSTWQEGYAGGEDYDYFGDYPAPNLFMHVPLRFFWARLAEFFGPEYIDRTGPMPETPDSYAYHFPTGDVYFNYSPGGGDEENWATYVFPLDSIDVAAEILSPEEEALIRWVRRRARRVDSEVLQFEVNPIDVPLLLVELERLGFTLESQPLEASEYREIVDFRDPGTGRETGRVLVARPNYPLRWGTHGGLTLVVFRLSFDAVQFHFSAKMPGSPNRVDRSGFQMQSSAARPPAKEAGAAPVSAPSMFGILGDAAFDLAARER